jgi:hypothetical protein
MHPELFCPQLFITECIELKNRLAVRFPISRPRRAVRYRQWRHSRGKSDEGGKRN